MKWQDYTRSLEHAVVITFKWAHATVPFRSDALEKLSTQIQSPHLEPHCPLGAKLHFLLLFINTHLKPKHKRINSAAAAKSLTRAKPRSTMLMLFVLSGYVVHVLWTLFKTRLACSIAYSIVISVHLRLWFLFSRILLTSWLSSCAHLQEPEVVQLGEYHQVEIDISENRSVSLWKSHEVLQMKASDDWDSPYNNISHINCWSYHWLRANLQKTW